MAFNLSVIAYAMPRAPLVGKTPPVGGGGTPVPEGERLAGVSPTERLTQCSNLFFMFK